MAGLDPASTSFFIGSQDVDARDRFTQAVQRAFDALPAEFRGYSLAPRSLRLAVRTRPSQG